MKVSVFGLGYVGSVSAAEFAADGHQVIGIDVNPDKVASVNAGRSPIVEPGLEALLADGVAQGRLRATTTTPLGMLERGVDGRGLSLSGSAPGFGEDSISFQLAAGEGVGRRHRRYVFSERLQKDDARASSDPS